MIIQDYIIKQFYNIDTFIKDIDLYHRRLQLH